MDPEVTTEALRVTRCCPTLDTEAFVLVVVVKVLPTTLRAVLLEVVEAERTRPTRCVCVADVADVVLASLGSAFPNVAATDWVAFRVLRTCRPAAGMTVTDAARPRETVRARAGVAPWVAVVVLLTARRTVRAEPWVPERVRVETARSAAVEVVPCVALRVLLVPFESAEEVVGVATRTLFAERPSTAAVVTLAESVTPRDFRSVAEDVWAEARDRLTRR
jgi:hypothetical protein